MSFQFVNPQEQEVNTEGLMDNGAFKDQYSTFTASNLINDEFMLQAIEKKDSATVRELSGMFINGLQDRLQKLSHSGSITRAEWAKEIAYGKQLQAEMIAKSGDANYENRSSIYGKFKSDDLDEKTREVWDELTPHYLPAYQQRTKDAFNEEEGRVLTSEWVSGGKYGDKTRNDKASNMARRYGVGYATDRELFPDKTQEELDAPDGMSMRRHKAFKKLAEERGTTQKEEEDRFRKMIGSHITENGSFLNEGAKSGDILYTIAPVDIAPGMSMLGDRITFNSAKNEDEALLQVAYLRDGDAYAKALSKTSEGENSFTTDDLSYGILGYDAARKEKIGQLHKMFSEAEEEVFGSDNDFNNYVDQYKSSQKKSLGDNYNEEKAIEDATINFYEKSAKDDSVLRWMDKVLVEKIGGGALSATQSIGYGLARGIDTVLMAGSGSDSALLTDIASDAVTNSQTRSSARNQVIGQTSGEDSWNSLVGTLSEVGGQMVPQVIPGVGAAAKALGATARAVKAISYAVNGIAAGGHVFGSNSVSFYNQLMQRAIDDGVEITPELKKSFRNTSDAIAAPGAFATGIITAVAGAYLPTIEGKILRSVGSGSVTTRSFNLANVLATTGSRKEILDAAKGLLSNKLAQRALIAELKGSNQGWAKMLGEGLKKKGYSSLSEGLEEGLAGGAESYLNAVGLSDEGLGKAASFGHFVNGFVDEGLIGMIFGGVVSGTISGTKEVFGLVKQSADNKYSTESLLEANKVVGEILNKGKSMLDVDKNSLTNTEEGKVLLDSVKNTYKAASLDTNEFKKANEVSKEAFKALPAEERTKIALARKEAGIASDDYVTPIESKLKPATNVNGKTNTSGKAYTQQPKTNNETTLKRLGAISKLKSEKVDVEESLSTDKQALADLQATTNVVDAKAHASKIAKLEKKIAKGEKKLGKVDASIESENVARTFETEAKARFRSKGKGNNQQKGTPYINKEQHHRDYKNDVKKHNKATVDFDLKWKKTMLKDMRGKSPSADILDTIKKLNLEIKWGEARLQELNGGNSTTVGKPSSQEGKPTSTEAPAKKTTKQAKKVAKKAAKTSTPKGKPFNSGGLPSNPTPAKKVAKTAPSNTNPSKDNTKPSKLNPADLNVGDKLMHDGDEVTFVSRNMKGLNVESESGVVFSVSPSAVDRVKSDPEKPESAAESTKKATPSPTNKASTTLPSHPKPKINLNSKDSAAVKRLGIVLYKIDSPHTSRDDLRNYSIERDILLKELTDSGVGITMTFRGAQKYDPRRSSFDSFDGWIRRLIDLRVTNAFDPITEQTIEIQEIERVLQEVGIDTNSFTLTQSTPLAPKPKFTSDDKLTSDQLAQALEDDYLLDIAGDDVQTYIENYLEHTFLSEVNKKKEGFTSEVRAVEGIESARMSPEIDGENINYVLEYDPAAYNTIEKAEVLQKMLFEEVHHAATFQAFVNEYNTVAEATKAMRELGKTVRNNPEQRAYLEAGYDGFDLDKSMKDDDVVAYEYLQLLKVRSVTGESLLDLFKHSNTGDGTGLIQTIKRWFAAVKKMAEALKLIKGDAYVAKMLGEIDAILEQSNDWKDMIDDFQTRKEAMNANTDEAIAKFAEESTKPADKAPERNPESAEDYLNMLKGDEDTAVGAMDSLFTFLNVSKVLRKGRSPFEKFNGKWVLTLAETAFPETEKDSKDHYAAYGKNPPTYIQALQLVNWLNSKQGNVLSKAGDGTFSITRSSIKVEEEEYETTSKVYRKLTDAEKETLKGLRLTGDKTAVDAFMAGIDQVDKVKKSTRSVPVLDKKGGQVMNQDTSSIYIKDFIAKHNSPLQALKDMNLKGELDGQDYDEIAERMSRAILFNQLTISDVTFGEIAPKDGYFGLDNLVAMTKISENPSANWGVSSHSNTHVGARMIKHYLNDAANISDMISQIERTKKPKGGSYPDVLIPLGSDFVNLMKSLTNPDKLKVLIAADNGLDNKALRALANTATDAYGANAELDVDVSPKDIPEAVLFMASKISLSGKVWVIKDRPLAAIHLKEDGSQDASGRNKELNAIIDNVANVEMEKYFRMKSDGALSDANKDLGFILDPEWNKKINTFTGGSFQKWIANNGATLNGVKVNNSNEIGYLNFIRKNEYIAQNDGGWLPLFEAYSKYVTELNNSISDRSPLKYWVNKAHEAAERGKREISTSDDAYYHVNHMMAPMGLASKMDVAMRRNIDQMQLKALFGNNDGGSAINSVLDSRLLKHFEAGTLEGEHKASGFSYGLALNTLDLMRQASGMNSTDWDEFALSIKAYVDLDNKFDNPTDTNAAALLLDGATGTEMTKPAEVLKARQMVENGISEFITRKKAKDSTDKTPATIRTVLLLQAVGGDVGKARRLVAKAFDDKGKGKGIDAAIASLLLDKVRVENANQGYGEPEQAKQFLLSSMIRPFIQSGNSRAYASRLRAFSLSHRNLETLIDDSDPDSVQFHRQETLDNIKRDIALIDKEINGIDQTIAASDGRKRFDLIRERDRLKQSKVMAGFNEGFFEKYSDYEHVKLSLGGLTPDQYRGFANALADNRSTRFEKVGDSLIALLSSNANHRQTEMIYDRHPMIASFMSSNSNIPVISYDGSDLWKSEVKGRGQGLLLDDQGVVVALVVDHANSEQSHGLLAQEIIKYQIDKGLAGNTALNKVIGGFKDALVELEDRVVEDLEGVNVSRVNKQVDSDIETAMDFNIVETTKELALYSKQLTTGYKDAKGKVLPINALSKFRENGKNNQAVRNVERKLVFYQAQSEENYEKLRILHTLESGVDYPTDKVRVQIPSDEYIERKPNGGGGYLKKGKEFLDQDHVESIRDNNTIESVKAEIAKGIKAEESLGLRLDDLLDSKLTPVTKTTYYRAENNLGEDPQMLPVGIKKSNLRDGFVPTRNKYNSTAGNKLQYIGDLLQDMNKLSFLQAKPTDIIYELMTNPNMHKLIAELDIDKLSEMTAMVNSFKAKNDSTYLDQMESMFTDYDFSVGVESMYEDSTEDNNEDRDADLNDDAEFDNSDEDGNEDSSGELIDPSADRDVDNVSEEDSLLSQEVDEDEDRELTDEELKNKVLTDQQKASRNLLELVVSEVVHETKEIPTVNDEMAKVMAKSADRTKLDEKNTREWRRIISDRDYQDSKNRGGVSLKVRLDEYISGKKAGIPRRLKDHLQVRSLFGKLPNLLKDTEAMSSADRLRSQKVLNIFKDAKNLAMEGLADSSLKRSKMSYINRSLDSDRSADGKRFEAYAIVLNAFNKYRDLFIDEASMGGAEISIVAVAQKNAKDAYEALNEKIKTFEIEEKDIAKGIKGGKKVEIKYTKEQEANRVTRTELYERNIAKLSAELDTLNKTIDDQVSKEFSAGEATNLFWNLIKVKEADPFKATNPTDADIALASDIAGEPVRGVAVVMGSLLNNEAKQYHDYRYLLKNVMDRMLEVSKGDDKLLPQEIIDAFPSEDTMMFMASSANKRVVDGSYFKEASDSFNKLKNTLQNIVTDANSKLGLVGSNTLDIDETVDISELFYDIVGMDEALKPLQLPQLIANAHANVAGFTADIPYSRIKDINTDDILYAVFKSHAEATGQDITADTYDKVNDVAHTDSKGLLDQREDLESKLQTYQGKLDSLNKIRDEYNQLMNADSFESMSGNNYMADALIDMMVNWAGRVNSNLYNTKKNSSFERQRATYKDFILKDGIGLSPEEMQKGHEFLDKIDQTISPETMALLVPDPENFEPNNDVAIPYAPIPNKGKEIPVGNNDNKVSISKGISSFVGDFNQFTTNGSILPSFGFTMTDTSQTMADGAMKSAVYHNDLVRNAYNSGINGEKASIAIMRINQTIMNDLAMVASNEQMPNDLRELGKIGLTSFAKGELRNSFDRYTDIVAYLIKNDIYNVVAPSGRKGKANKKILEGQMLHHPAMVTTKFASDVKARQMVHSLMRAVSAGVDGTSGVNGAKNLSDHYGDRIDKAVKGMDAKNIQMATLMAQVLVYNPNSSLTSMEAIDRNINIMESSIETMKTAGLMNVSRHYKKTAGEQIKIIEQGLLKVAAARDKHMDETDKNAFFALVEAELFNTLSPAQVNFINETRSVFAELDPAVALSMASNGRERGNLSNYVPLTSYSNDQLANSDFDSVLTSLPEGSYARTRFKGKEDTAINLNGDRTFKSSVKSMAYSLSTNHSYGMIGDVFGVEEDTMGAIETKSGKIMDFAGDEKAAELAVGDTANFISKLSKLKYDNDHPPIRHQGWMEETVLSGMELGMMQGLTSKWQPLLQTAPILATYIGRNATSPKKTALFMKYLVGIHGVDKQKLAEKIRILAPDIADRGFDGGNANMTDRMWKKWKDYGAFKKAITLGALPVSLGKSMYAYFLNTVIGKIDGWTIKAMIAAEYESRTGKSLMDTHIDNIDQSAFVLSEIRAEDSIALSNDSSKSNFLQHNHDNVALRLLAKMAASYGNHVNSIMASANSGITIMRKSSTKAEFSEGLGMLTEAMSQTAWFTLTKVGGLAMIYGVLSSVFGGDDEDEEKSQQEFLDFVNKYMFEQKRKAKVGSDYWSSYSVDFGMSGLNALVPWTSVSLPSNIIKDGVKYSSDAMFETNMVHDGFVNGWLKDKFAMSGSLGTLLNNTLSGAEVYTLNEKDVDLGVVDAGYLAATIIGADRETRARLVQDLQEKHDVKRFEDDKKKSFKKKSGGKPNKPNKDEVKPIAFTFGKEGEAVTPKKRDNPFARNSFSAGKLNDGLSSPDRKPIQPLVKSRTANNDVSDQSNDRLSSVKVVSDDFLVVRDAKLKMHRSNDGDSFYTTSGDKSVEFRLYHVDTPEKLFRKYKSGDDNSKHINKQMDYFGLSQDNVVKVGQTAKSFTHNLLKDNKFELVSAYSDNVTAGRKYTYAVVNYRGKDVYLHELLVAQGLVMVNPLDQKFNSGGELTTHERGTMSKANLPDGSSYVEHHAKLKRIEEVAKKEKRGAWGMQGQ